MIYCTVMHERNPNRENPELENITLDEVIENFPTLIMNTHGKWSRLMLMLFQTAAL